MTDNPFNLTEEEKGSVNPFDLTEDEKRQTGGLASPSSAAGSFARGAERGAVPALGGLAAAGAGAEAGFALGAFGGPLAPVTAPLGAVLGGIAGGFGGSWLAAKGQDYALSKAPDAWKEKIGLDDRQAQLDQQLHPYASFLGGIAPYAVTMKPGGFTRGVLPENPTAFQTIMAHPLTARVFGGAAMGGMEAGQELASGEHLDWTKTGISTGFGIVFNKPTRFGERLTELGARPVRGVLGRPEPTVPAAPGAAPAEAPPAEEALAAAPRAPATPLTERDWNETILGQKPPTVAQAGEHTLGPGNVEETYLGTQEKNESARMAAAQAVRDEREALGEPAQSQTDLHETARAMEPAFARYDELTAQRNTFAAYAADHPESEVARARLEGADKELAELHPQIQAAYRRASESAAGETAEPPPVPYEAAPSTFIVDDARRRLIAAGRPPEEAEAAAHVTAALYQTRASRFGGALGTAEELYSREAPSFRGPDGRVYPPLAAPKINGKPQGAPAEALHETGAPGIRASTLEDADRIKNQWRRESTYAPDRIISTSTDNINSETAPNNREPWVSVDRGKQATPAAAQAQGFVAQVGSAAERINSSPSQLENMPAYSPEAAAALPPGEVGLFKFDPTTLNVDAQRFQFKSGGDEYGVTGALRRVTKWDPMKAQSIMVWQQNDGKLFVADGHQRSGLARRLVEQGKESNLRIGGILLRESDGISASDARAFAAAANIANGSGSALDGARVLRARPDLIGGLSELSEGKGEQAVALARLDDEAFRMVVNDVVPEHYGAIVGKLLPNDGPRQVAAMKAISRFEPKNVEEAAVLTQRVAQAELAKAHEGAQTSMFGDLETPESTAGEEMKIVGRAISDLKKDKTLFSRVVANAERIEQTGSVIQRETARSVTSDAELFSRRLASDAYSAGPLRQELIAAARELKDGKTQIGEATARILAALRREAENDVPRGARVGEGTESEAHEYAQSDSFEFEPGAEGKPQALVPGVAPARDADRLRLQAAAPLRRGPNKELGADSLFGDSHLQQELFKTATDQGSLFQGARGKIRFEEGRRPLITIMRDGNASTAIHELGHARLEEMARDAAHAQAPADVKADWQAVSDWLGIRSHADLAEKTPSGRLTSKAVRAHEKFARGFEQYLREGVAPSRQLAGVFAKFRSWLLNIYQTLKGLGSPINDDIHGVFDRLLAVEPQRTVITPERAGGPSFADIHETDARETEPHEAEAAADRVLAERTREHQERPPEILNEIASKQPAPPAETAGGEQGGAGTGTGGAAVPRAEDGAGAVGPANVGGDGRGPEPQPGSGGARQEHGAERGGGGSAAAEGQGAPGQPQRGGANAEQHPLAPGPATLIGAAESPFVEKAGNIRLDTLNTTEDVKQAIRDSAEANDDFIGDRRGVITDGQVLELADALGMDANTLSRRKLGQAFNAEQIVAARKLLLQSAMNVSEAMKKAATGTDEDVMAYAMARDRHQMVQGQVSGITAEAGRALRAFRTLAGQETAEGVDQFLRSASAKTLFQLREEAKLGATLDTPAKVSKYLADAQKRSFGRMVLEYWVNGLISNPVTHMTYMAGNEILRLSRAVPETAAAALVSRVRQSMGGEAGVRIGEVGAQLKARLSSTAQAGEAALEAVRSGQTTLLPGEKARPTIPFQGDTALTFARNTTNEPVTWSDLAGSAYSTARGLKDAIVSGAELMRSGVEGAPLIGLSYSPLGQIPDLAIRGVRLLPGLVPGGTQFRLPGRMVAAIHSFYRTGSYSMEKAALAFRQASSEGLTGNDFNRRVAELRANPSEELMEQARHGATESTLMGQGSQFVQALGRLTNTPILGFPYLKFVDPFVHIAGSIIDQSIVHRTPVGLLAPEIRADVMGHNGPAAQDFAIGRMLVGTALSITMGGLAAEGYVSGSGPSDPHEAAMWRLAGNQSHSLRIGDMWYDMHKLGPLGMNASVAADLYQVGHLISDGDASEAASHLMHAFTHTIMDESFMRGPADLIKAVEDSDRYGARYVQNMVSSFVPFSVAMGQWARSSDPYSRQARSVMDSIRQKLPFDLGFGKESDLFPRRDLWGEPMPSRTSGVPYTSIYTTQISRDPVNLAMLDLGISPAAPTRKIRGQDLTDQEYDDFSRIAGRMTKMRLDAIVRSPDYGTWPNHIKERVINETVKQSRESARGVVMMKYPRIASDATKEKLDALKD